MRNQTVFKMLFLAVCLPAFTALHALGQDAINPNTACATITSSGTARAGRISKFTTACNIEASTAILEKSGNVGLGTAAPYARLDVRGSSSSLPNVVDSNMVAVFDNGGNATNVWTNVLSAPEGGTDTNYYFAMDGGIEGGIRYNVVGDYVALFHGTSYALNSEPFVLKGRNVGIGTLTPANNLEIVAGGTTLADSWTTRSSRQFKTDIQPLQGALEKIEQLQGVSYNRKADGKREIGVVAEDVDRVVPEVVAHDPKTLAAEGVDYSRLSALLIEAVKSQQDEIEQLKAQVQLLSSKE